MPDVADPNVTRCTIDGKSERVAEPVRVGGRLVTRGGDERIVSTDCVRGPWRRMIYVDPDYLAEEPSGALIVARGLSAITERCIKVSVPTEREPAAVVVVARLLEDEH